MGVIFCNCINPLGSLVPSIYMLPVYSDSFHFALIISLLCSRIHQRRHFAVTVCPASRLMACAVWLSAHNAVARAVDARPGGTVLLRVTAALEPLHPRMYLAMTPGWHLASSTVVGVMSIVLSIRKRTQFPILGADAHFLHSTSLYNLTLSMKEEKKVLTAAFRPSYRPPFKYVPIKLHGTCTI